jgi:predicted membrane protein
MIFRYILGLALVIAGLDILLNIKLWQYFWPLILIFLGLFLLFNQPRWRNWENMGGMSQVTQEQLNIEAVFSPLNKQVITDDFKGGKVSSVFGGGVLDLTRAKIKPGTEVNLEIEAVFGGIKIIVPREWQVITSVSAVAGGFSEKLDNSKLGAKAPVLRISGSVVFGGGEVVSKEGTATEGQF